jgi:hypothetical protein
MQYEYQTYSSRHLMDPELLSQWGEAGWELCSCAVLPETNTLLYYYYFKRSYAARAQNDRLIRMG